jgi:polyisoprenyl-phosphate glycosyltransferase
MDISVVVPVYGCRAALPELHRRLVSALEGMGKSFEIILVNDACPQNSWEEIELICAADSRVKGVRLSRNFGQIRAITAGLDLSQGDWVVVMDCDLQDRPESIPELYDKAQEGYDVVFARRIARKDTGLVKALSRAFYKVYDYFTNGNYDSSLCNFSISRRIVIDNYCRMREHNRAYTMFIKWLGFTQTAIDLEGDERFEGESSYSFKKKMNMAFELITAQSTKPLKFAVHAGFFFATLAILAIVVLIVRYLLDPSHALVGWTSTIAAICFMGGLNLAAIGVVGLYVGNIFNEAKQRPLYVVAEVLNGEEGVK